MSASMRAARDHVQQGRKRKAHLTDEEIRALLDDSDIDLSDDDSDEFVPSDNELPVHGNSASATDSEDDADSEHNVSDSDDADQEPPTKSPRRMIWRKSDEFSPVLPPVIETEDLAGDHQNWTPVQYFQEYFKDELYDMLTTSTNIKHHQVVGTPLRASQQEMKKFIGINILMGCFNMKRIRTYWQRNTRVPVIAKAMTRDRFFKIRNYLKVVDDSTCTEEERKADKLWKIRGFLDCIRKTCLSLPREANVCIDEQMISFTGRCPSRQYVPRKPNPTGLKNFVLAGESGLVLDFEIYQGENTFSRYQMENKKKVNQGEGAVLRLVETLSHGHRLFCDRFFVTIPLISHLQQMNILLTGTIQRNYIPVTFKTDKVMKAEGRGASEQAVSSSDISIVKWHDNKPILMASSAFGKEPQDECLRWSKKDKQHIHVKRPAVIKAYNKSMGGVDLCDRMISYHKIGSRSKKWPVRVIMHFLDLVLSNCWVRFRSEHPQQKLQLYDFRIAVGTTLIQELDMNLSDTSSSDSDEQGMRGGIVDIPPKTLRRRSARHMPIAVELKNAARCRNEGCPGKTRVKCILCNVFLCLQSGRNCFKEFHRH